MVNAWNTANRSTLRRICRFRRVRWTHRSGSERCALSTNTQSRKGKRKRDNAFSRFPVPFSVFPSPFSLFPFPFSLLLAQRAEGIDAGRTPRRQCRQPGTRGLGSSSSLVWVLLLIWSSVRRAVRTLSLTGYFCADPFVSIPSQRFFASSPANHFQRNQTIRAIQPRV